MDDLNFARPECEIDQPFNPFDDPNSWDYPDDVDAEYQVVVPLKYIISVVNPLKTDVWGCGHIDLNMVEQAIPLNEQWNPDDDNQIWTAKKHAGRIKFLSLHPLDPICFDVGVPSLGYDVQKVLDGHHRIVAAIYNHDDYISCKIQGDIDYIHCLLEKWTE